jgi:vancomycin resistance protein VanJ
MAIAPPQEPGGPEPPPGGKGVPGRTVSHRDRWLSPLWGLAVVLTAWVGQRLGERWWLTTWVLYLPPLLFVAPVLVWGLLALALRRWRTLGGHLVVGLVGTVLLCRGAYRLPRPATRGDFRVMTWNVRALTLDPEGVLATIRRESPDVVLLEEVEREARLDPFRWLRQRLPGWQGVRRSDVALLTPHPLGRAQPHFLGPPGSNRVALEAPVRIGGHTVRIVVAHFSTALPGSTSEGPWRHPRFHMQVAAAVRREQTDRLTALIGKANRPLVVGGDFNSPPGSYLDGQLSRLLPSAFMVGGAGFGWSFPANLPLLRIDHLYVSDELRVLNCRVLPVRASDHRPLVADLGWRERKN